jgi:AcrR family transcriptional regulator
MSIISVEFDNADAMPVRRRDVAEWRRDKILDAALEVFGSKGVDGASMKEVAAAAKVAPGLLYHYFTSKEALSTAVVVERGFNTELRALLNAAGQRPASEVLTEVTIGFERILASRKSLIGMFVSLAGSSKNRLGFEGVMREAHSLLGDYLAGRVSAGELRPHDRHAAVHILFSACAFGHMIGEPLDPAALAEIVLDGISVARPV